MSWISYFDGIFASVTGQITGAVLLILVGVVLRSLFIGSKIKKLENELQEFRSGASSPKIEHELRDVYQELKRQRLLGRSNVRNDVASKQAAVSDAVKPHAD